MAVDTAPKPTTQPLHPSRRNAPACSYNAGGHRRPAGPRTGIAHETRAGICPAGASTIDAAQAPRFDIDEQARAAFAASETWISLQSPRRLVAADDLNGVRRIDGFRRIGAPVHGLTVVAMAVHLHDRFGGDFDLDRSAAALDFGHSLRSNSAAMARSRAGRSSKTVRQTCSSATSS